MASARRVDELGSVMDTESDQSSENRDKDSSSAGMAQHTAALGWGEPAGLVPAWSVPPGLVIPISRTARTDAPGVQTPDVQDSASANADLSNEPLAAGHGPALDDAEWPGI